MAGSPSRPATKGQVVSEATDAHIARRILRVPPRLARALVERIPPLLAAHGIKKHGLDAACLFLCLWAVLTLPSWYANPFEPQRFPIDRRALTRNEIAALLPGEETRRAVAASPATAPEGLPDSHASGPRFWAVPERKPIAAITVRPGFTYAGLDNDQNCNLESNDYAMLRFASGQVILSTSHGELPIKRWHDMPEAETLPLYAMQSTSGPAPLAALAIERAFCMVDAPRITQPPRKQYGVMAFRRGNYKEHIDSFANRFNLSPALVYGIMRTESNFNPNAVSRANALGLMQVVPSTAGTEVHAFLTGNPAVPEAATLLKPKENILYGTAYLHLLLSRHFAGVRSSTAREFCAIAAYNGGPGAVLRVFHPKDPAAAIDAINDLTPNEVYNRLRTSMPYAESRRYIDKVLNAMRDVPGGAREFSTAAGHKGRQGADSELAVNIDLSEKTVIETATGQEGENLPTVIFETVRSRWSLQQEPAM